MSISSSSRREYRPGRLRPFPPPPAVNGASSGSARSAAAVVDDGLFFVFSRYGGDTGRQANVVAPGGGGGVAVDVAGVSLADLLAGTAVAIAAVLIGVVMICRRQKYIHSSYIYAGD